MEGSTTLDMSSISTAIGNVFTVCGKVLNEIVSNPLFLMFFVLGLIFAAINVVRALKH